MSDDAVATTGRGPSADLFAEVRIGSSTDRDGAVLLWNELEPAPYPVSILDRLQHWADVAPQRVCLGERSGAGWRTLTYAEVWAEVQLTARRLLALELGAERPLAIIAPNSIAHATAALAGMLLGVPVAALAAPPPDDASRALLMQRIALLTPGAVVIGGDVTAGIAKLSRAAAPVFGLEREAPGAPPLDELPLASPAGAAAAARAVTPDTVAKLLFTSGSTGAGKAVINTHRMLVSNQAALAQVWPFLQARPPRLVDWLPWRHTFGGNFCLNLALFNGGSLYIDDGSPLPGRIGRTVENLRSEPPSVYFNVPAGYEALLPHLEADPDFARRYFGDLELLFNAGAALPETTYERLRSVALSATGRELPLIGSWGLTETAPAATMVYSSVANARNIGAPLPGVTIKLAPDRDRLELRVKGPNVTPGYWRRADATAAAFDEDGFLKTGDAGRLVDPARPGLGLVYDGRIAENFKLLSGTWVNAEAVRLAAIEAAGPLVSNAVVAGLNRDHVGVLLFLDLDTCRAMLGTAAAGLDDAAVATNRVVLDRVRHGLAAHNASQAGGSRRIGRFLVLDQPPDLAAGEVTTKGSLNQAVLLERRAAAVERLYAVGQEVPADAC